MSWKRQWPTDRFGHTSVLSLRTHFTRAIAHRSQSRLLHWCQKAMPRGYLRWHVVTGSRLPSSRHTCTGERAPIAVCLYTPGIASAVGNTTNDSARSTSSLSTKGRPCLFLVGDNLSHIQQHFGRALELAVGTCVVAARICTCNWAIYTRYSR